MFIGKEGGYTLRTFKKMVKRAKEDNPEMFEKLMKGEAAEVDKPWERPPKVEPKKAVADEDDDDTKVEGEEAEKVEEEVPLVEAEEEGPQILTADDLKEMKEKDLRKMIAEMKADSDEEDPI
jgi:hypothetical protein